MCADALSIVAITGSKEEPRHETPSIDRICSLHLCSLQWCLRPQCRAQTLMYLSEVTLQLSKYMAGAIMVAEVITMDGAAATSGDIITIGDSTKVPNRQDLFSCPVQCHLLHLWPTGAENGRG